MYMPYEYAQVNVSEGLNIPSDISYKSWAMDYWTRALFQRASYVLDIQTKSFEGTTKDFLLWCLFKYGYVSMWEDDKKGLVFNPCTLKGYNMYYQPTNCLITNPAFDKSLDLEIGKECALIKLTPDFMGIWDIITYYARRLAMIDSAIDVSIMNNKVPFIGWGTTPAAVQALKKIVDKIQSGVSAVFYDGKLVTKGNMEDPIKFIDRPNMKQSYLTSDQLMDQATLLKSFDREIGIPTIPYEKKERLVSDEANSAIIDSQARVTIWKETLEESFKICNDMFGTDFSVKMRIGPMEQMQEGSEENGTS